MNRLRSSSRLDGPDILEYVHTRKQKIVTRLEGVSYEDCR